MLHRSLNKRQNRQFSLDQCLFWNHSILFYYFDFFNIFLDQKSSAKENMNYVEIINIRRFDIRGKIFSEQKLRQLDIHKNS